MRKQLIRTPGVLFYRHNGFEGVALLCDAHNFTRTTDLGPMNCRCPGCQCMKFVEETPAFCCGNGKHRIVNHPPHPDYLQRLFDGRDADSAHFLANIRKYNCAFQMTSQSGDHYYLSC